MAVRKKKIEFYKVILKTLDDKKSDIKLIMAVYIPAPNFTPPIGITLYVSTIAATRY